MDYETLLDEAYEKVEVNEGVGERFEIIKVRGHHEGVRTIISNFSQIVAHIRRSSEHFLKFLSKELASQGEIKGDRLVLSRKLSSRDVNDKIEKYVNEFVLCSKCGKPDTELSNEGSKVFLKCLACGAKQEVHKV